MSDDGHTPELKRELGLFSAIAIVSGIMIGSGIFLVSPGIAQKVQSPGLLLGIWIFTLVVTLFGTMSYGKLAVAIPEAGGQYLYLKKAWGKLPAFLYGWALFFVIQTGTVAAVGVAFAKFLGVLVPSVSSDNIVWAITDSFGISMQQVIAIAVIAFLTLYNCRGVKEGAVLQNIFTVLKVIAVIALVGVGIFFGRNGLPSPSQWWVTPQAPLEHSVFVIFAIATVGSLFSADAWNNVTFIGSEVKNPKVNLPKAMIWGAFVVCALYVLVNVAYVNLLPFDLLQHPPEDRIATAAMSHMFGSSAAAIMAVVIMVSTFGCLNGLILAGARVFYAMAKDNLFFKVFGTVDPNYHTPTVSLIGQGLWSCGLALSGSYGQLLDYIMFTTLLFYIITALGLIKMGRKDPETFQMTRPLDYVIPVVYMLLVAYVSINLALFKQEYTLPGLAIVCAGIPIFFVWQALYNKPSET